MVSQSIKSLSSDSKHPRTQLAPQALQYGDVAGLEQSIDAAYSRASRRLFEIFFNKFGLLRHLRALKDYLLLGRGDFVEMLIESLGCVTRACADHVLLTSEQPVAVETSQYAVPTQSDCDARNGHSRLKRCGRRR